MIIICKRLRFIGFENVFFVLAGGQSTGCGTHGGKGAGAGAAAAPRGRGVPAVSLSPRVRARDTL